VGEGRRTRGTTAYPAPRQSIIGTLNGNSGTLPTPDPTVGSCVSEEDKDVALQLMRLGEMTNNSHGRTSASTLDDAFSGRADAASTTEATSDAESDSEDDLPPARRQKREESGGPVLSSIKRLSKHPENCLQSQDCTDSGDEAECEDGRDSTFRPDAQDPFLNDLVKSKVAKTRSILQSKPRAIPSSTKGAKVNKPSKPHRPALVTKSKAKTTTGAGASRPPISPTSLPSQSRKASATSALNFQHQLGDDEEDLSSKPRCQRCRKSKKGCDRQRPCQRCKDAGLSADQCVSEDEGNGRKGRYGRHMGVPVKKEELQDVNGASSSGIVAGNGNNSDKNRKRKR
jgi:Fungal Zn(2)-Cys(6) binuclear cluster domain